MPDARSRARKIKLLLLDVDGVLTDGKIYHLSGPRGKLVEFKGVDTQDGIGLVWLVENGIRTGVISGRKSAGFAARARDLRMTYIVQGTLAKVAAFEKILKDARLRAEQAAFIGDDLTDIPLIRRVGLGIAAANARPEVKRAARYTTRARGGAGAVREAAELILDAQGLWAPIKKLYEA